MKPEVFHGLKFGGTSMDGISSMTDSARATKNHLAYGRGVGVVVSAIAGETNQNFIAINQAMWGDDYKATILESSTRHTDLVDEFVGSEGSFELHRKIDVEEKRSLEYLDIVAERGVCDNELRDAIVSRGERLMSGIFAAFLRENGVNNAVEVPAESIFITDAKFGNATSRMPQVRKRVKALVLPLFDEGKTVVTGGYYGITPDGRFTTEGRGGSDATLTKLLRAIVETRTGSKALATAYKNDVSGMMSGNPRRIPNAFLHEHTSYEVAAAAAGLGANILHPRAINHAAIAEFPLEIRNTKDFEKKGTIINSEADDVPVRVITALEDMHCLSLEGWGMDRPGIIRRLSSVFERQGIDIRFIAQPPTEQQVHFLISQQREPDALLSQVIRLFRNQLRAKDIRKVDLAQASLVGIAGSGVASLEVEERINEGLQKISGLKEGAVTRITTNIEPVHAVVFLNDDGKIARQAELALHETIFDLAA